MGKFFVVGFFDVWNHKLRKENSSEVIIPVLEHGQLHFGSGCVSELNIMITIAISPRASLRSKNHVCFGNAP